MSDSQWVQEEKRRTLEALDKAEAKSRTLKEEAMRHDPETGLTTSGTPVDPKYHHPQTVFTRLITDPMSYEEAERQLQPMITVEDAERYSKKLLKLQRVRSSVIEQMKRYLDSIDKKIEWLEQNIRSFMVANKQATGASTFTLDGVRLSIRKKSPKWVIRDPEVFHEWCESSIRMTDYPELFDHVLRKPRVMKMIVKETVSALEPYQEMVGPSFKGEPVPGLEWYEPVTGDVSVSVKEEKDAE